MLKIFSFLFIFAVYMYLSFKSKEHVSWHNKSKTVSASTHALISIFYSIILDYKASTNCQLIRIKNLLNLFSVLRNKSLF